MRHTVDKIRRAINWVNVNRSLKRIGIIALMRFFAHQRMLRKQLRQTRQDELLGRHIVLRDQIHNAFVGDVFTGKIAFAHDASRVEGDLFEGLNA